MSTFALGHPIAVRTRRSGGAATAYAIRKNGHNCPVTNNGTIVGTQA